MNLAPESVLLLSRSPLGADASSAWAQGGLAASLGEDDEPALHLSDTLAAGDGLCDALAARRIVYAAPDAIEDLARLGVRFDRTPAGALRLGLEAAHGRRRIVHADGDGSGREMMRALVAAVRSTPTIAVIEGIEARRLAVEDGRITGAVASSATSRVLLATGRVVLATGGIGGLFHDTTNPLGSCGQGLALAARAGATLANLEFIQFHPEAGNSHRVTSSRSLETSSRPPSRLPRRTRKAGRDIRAEFSNDRVSLRQGWPGPRNP